MAALSTLCNLWNQKATNRMSFLNIIDQSIVPVSATFACACAAVLLDEAISEERAGSIMSLLCDLSLRYNEEDALCLRTESFSGVLAATAKRFPNSPIIVDASSKMLEMINPSRNEKNEVETASNLSEQEVNGIIDGTDSLIQDMISIPGNSEVLASIILGTINEHVDVPAVQTYCLRMIWDTCKDNDENKDALMVAGAPLKILEAMRAFPDSPSVQEKGCGAIWSLGVNSSNRVILIRAQACQQIVQALKRYSSTESVVCTAIGALRALSPEAEARELLCSLGAPQLVSEAMSLHRECVSVQRDGCALLSNCAIDIEKQVVKVVPFEELDAVVQAMACHRNELSVMQGGCFALKNFTHEEINCRKVRQCKGIIPLMEYAAKYEASPGCMENAADILERLKMSSMMDESIEEKAFMEISRFSSSKSNKLEVQLRILDYMKDFVWSPRLTSAMLEILRKMLHENVSQVHHLFSSGAIQDVLKYCKEVSRDERVCSEGCSIIVACLAANVEYHESLLEAGASFFLFKSLKHYSNVEIVKNALEALSILSSNERWFQEIKQQMLLITEACASHPENDVVLTSYLSILSMIRR